MLASIVFATVALVACLNANPAALPPSNPNVAVQCKYWVPTEKCMMNNMRKYKSEHDYEKDVHMNSHHHMMKQDHEHKECLNKIDWWVKCPSSYADFAHCDDLDENEDKMNLKNCRYSCQQCGEDAFLTVEKSYDSKKIDKCAEFSHHYPFHCVKPAAEMKVELAHIIANYIPSVASNCVTTPVDYCVEFDYRRRGSQDPQAQTHTEFTICEQLEAGEEDVLHEELAPTCKNAAKTAPYASHDECVYNKWFRATYQFATIAANDNCDHIRRIILEVKRGVDFFDIDNFHVYEGVCHKNDGTPLTPGAAINVELVQKPTPTP